MDLREESVQSDMKVEDHVGIGYRSCFGSSEVDCLISGGSEVTFSKPRRC